MTYKIRMPNVRFFIFLFIALWATPAVSAPMRIVTLSPVTAEWVAEVLGEKETQKRLVGVTEYSIYPKYLTKIESVGPYPQVHIEKILKLKPDLIIAVEGTNRPDQVEKLKRLKLPVKLLAKETFDTMGEWILKLGSMLGEDRLGQAARDRWEFELKALDPGERRTIFVEIQSSPLVTIGAGSFLTPALKKKGFHNIFEDLSQDYPKVSREAVLKLKPDQVWILDLNGDRKLFERSQAEWERSGQDVRIIKGDDYARCSMRLLKALKSLK